MNLVNSFLVFLFNAVRPLLGPPSICNYTVSCRVYAIAQLQQKSLLKALAAITKRMLSCNPFTIPQ